MSYSLPLVTEDGGGSLQKCPKCGTFFYLQIMLPVYDKKDISMTTATIADFLTSMGKIIIMWKMHMWDLLKSGSGSGSLSESMHGNNIRYRSRYRQIAGALKAKHQLPLPEMIQMAVALQTEKPAIITNDKALKKVTEVKVYLLDDLI